MKAAGATYDPTLSVWEGQAHLAAGEADSSIDRSCSRQWPRRCSHRRARSCAAAPRPTRAGRPDCATAADGDENLKRAYEAGVTLVTGSDAGNPLVLHGPTVQHELQLWVAAGIPAGVALQAATFNAARLLRADSTIGLVVRVTTPICS